MKTKNSTEHGIALVITLILLAVITFMTVAFLVLSRHAAKQVDTTTQQLIAQQAAQAALDQAEARILAQMLAQNNGFNFGLMVSTNFQTPFYDTTQPPGTVNVANVSYNDGFGAQLTGNAYLQMLNNQLVLPRPPVFVSTNTSRPPDFRYYLDLNRNGLFDSNGPGVTGDPEWIGILQHPDQPHSRSNFYIARYAFLAQPIGNSLDINYVHNQAKQLATNFDGFLRDQGVGSWEINLAGFLYALNPLGVLNPNGWDYGSYDSRSPVLDPGSSFSSGSAFEDAASLTAFRYNGSYNNLAPFLTTSLFTTNNPNLIDYFSVGAPSLPTKGNWWSGSDDLNRLFTSQDWFVQPLGNFPGRLYNAGRAGGTFNEYTYYRMLSQMGTESAPEPTNKLNLNYDNLDPVISNGVAVYPPSPTNFLSWAQVPFQPGLEFFTNAANRLLGSHTNFVINVNGYIAQLSAGFIPIYIANLTTPSSPVYPSNYYTPSVHRMLQLAANIYDAANPKPIVNPGDFDYPSVFRPTFSVMNITNTNTLQILQVVYINGYQEVGPLTDPGPGLNYATRNPVLSAPYSLPQDFAAVVSNIVSPTATNGINIYDVPWVIGVKKGLPNFNQISMQSFAQIARKVQIVKDHLYDDRKLWHTNIQYVVSLTNVVAAEAWNSYLTNYPRSLDIGGIDNIAMALSNEVGVVTASDTFKDMTLSNTVAGSWLGYPGAPTNGNRPDLVSLSFKIPLLLTNTFLVDSIYVPVYASGRLLSASFTPIANVPATYFQSTVGYPLPQFELFSTNRLRFWMVDAGPGGTGTHRIIDYVQLGGMSYQRDLVGELKGSDAFGPGGLWATNRVNGTTDLTDPVWGMLSQIQASLQPPPFTNGDYNDYPTVLTGNDWANMAYPPPRYSNPINEAAQFNAFYNPSTPPRITNLSMQVPYTPTRQVSAYFTWQANDPLVHYTLSDLTGLGDMAIAAQTNYVYSNMVTGNILRVNQRYRPWAMTLNAAPNDAYTYNLALKDPMITRSDDWQFPSGKFASLGWLGRVHRGTPWQTVYMKSAPVNFTTWQNWTGNAQGAPGNLSVSDALTSLPVNDWAIFDLFTTAPNDNATRGQLSINQPNFAAWAAVLDGVTVESNLSQGAVVPLVIDPNTNGLFLSNVVASINAVRSATNGGVFTQLGQILSVPQLSVNSPFLDTINNTPTDEEYERIPQQIMSLLRVGSPRYVIYAYGQSLKPADNSLQTGGPYYGTCTNYQITGEMVTRTVLSFEPSKPAPLISTTPGVTYSNFVFNVLNPTQNPVMPGQVLTNQPPPRAVIQNFNVLPPE